MRLLLVVASPWEAVTLQFVWGGAHFTMSGGPVPALTLDQAKFSLQQVFGVLRSSFVTAGASGALFSRDDAFVVIRSGDAPFSESVLAQTCTPRTGYFFHYP